MIATEVGLILTIFLGGVLLLYLMGVPVAVAMGMTSVFIMISPFGRGLNYELIASQLLFGVSSFTILAVPFYLLLGRLMNRIGITERIFRFATALVGQFRGGIAYVNIVASMIFSGMSGLAVADAAGLGRVEYKSMRDEGYDKDISLGVTGSSAIIGPIIPPSVVMIIYGILAEESIGDLFIAGIIPGVLIGLLLMAFVMVMVVRRGYQGGDSFTTKEAVESFKGAFMPLLTPILIIGGILSGWFTATEAGAIAVLYVIAMGFYYGELDLHGLYLETRDSMVETFALMFIVGVAALYGLIALQLQLPIFIAESVTGLTSDPTMILLLLVLVLLVVGTFLETMAAITILVPILLPVLNIAGIDTLHFGIVMVLTLMLGLLTPPLGVILFVLEKVTDATIEEIVRAVIPFYIPILIVILLIVFFPSIALFLPTL